MNQICYAVNPFFNGEQVDVMNRLNCIPVGFNGMVDTDSVEAILIKKWDLSYPGVANPSSVNAWECLGVEEWVVEITTHGGRTYVVDSVGAYATLYTIGWVVPDGENAELFDMAMEANGFDGEAIAYWRKYELCPTEEDLAADAKNESGKSVQ